MGVGKVPPQGSLTLNEGHSLFRRREKVRHVLLTHVDLSVEPQQIPAAGHGEGGHQESEGGPHLDAALAEGLNAKVSRRSRGRGGGFGRCRAAAGSCPLYGSR